LASISCYKIQINTVYFSNLGGIENASLATAASSVPPVPATNGENYFGAAFQDLG